MKTIFPKALFSSCLLLASLAHADETKILQLLDNYVASVNNLDMELAGQIWSQSQDSSFIHPRGHQKGFADISKEFYLNAMGNFSERDLELQDINIRMLSDDTAWLDLYWEFNAVFAKDNIPITTKGRETQVLYKETDSWRIVHVHYSNMPVTGAREGF